MKKIAILLATVIIFSCFSLCAFAEEAAPVYAEISDIENGQLTVSLYGDGLQSLVSFNVRVQYDTEIFCYKDGYAAFALDEDGNTIDNFSGLWAFGELADGSGCTGACISSSGTSRSGKVKICEFVLGVTGKRTASSDISVDLTELVTEDDDYENDIYSSQAINSANLCVEYEDLFEFNTTSDSAQITDCFYDACCMDIPATLSGVPVTSLAFSSPVSAPFVFIPENVTNIAEGVFSSPTVVICPENSYAHIFFSENGLSVFSYKNTTPVTQNNIFVTDAFLINDQEFLFGGDAQRSITSSHSGYYGTGSEISLLNGENTLFFTLSVMGDINGDSVCDALDASICEKAANGKIKLSEEFEFSSDMNCDETISVQDFMSVVNKALST